MNLLAIETATDACSVAVLSARGISQRHRVAPREHTAIVFDLLDECLAEATLKRADVGAVAFGHGPGAFTGVRIAATLAQGIALPRALPVLAVSTLAALAEGARRRGHAGRIVAALDARRGEIYAASFDAGGAELVRLTDDVLLAPEDLLLPGGDDWLAIGTAWQPYHARFAPSLGALRCAAETLPEARDIATLAMRDLAAGGGRPASEALPRYLRGALD